MKKPVLPLVLFLCLAPAPASASLHWSECVAEPNYDCMVRLAVDEAVQAPSRVERAFALALVASVQAVGGRNEEALQNAVDALHLGGIVQDDAAYGFLVARLIRAHAWAGDLETAENMLGWIAGARSLALGYAALAEGQLRHGREDAAARSMGWAMENAAEVSSDRDSLIPQLALSYAYLGDADGVSELTARARDLASGTERPYARVLPLAVSAVAEAMVGHIEASDAFLAETDEGMAAVESELDLAILVAHIAWALAEQGDAEGARATIAQLIQLDLRGMTYTQRALLFAYCAMALAEVG